MLGVLGVTLYLLVNEEGKFSGIYGEQQLNHIEISQEGTVETTPLASALQSVADGPIRSATADNRPAQSRPPKTAPPMDYKGTAFRQKEDDFPFYIVKREWNTKKGEYEFFRRGTEGTEVTIRSDARRYFISENQADYPEPASGCSPTALLNLYIWYSKFGLLQESVAHSNPETYKELKFKEIDRKLLDIQRQSRTRKGGTDTLAAIVAMDELVQQYSGKRKLRLHFEIKQPPLKLKDITNLSAGYRAGILSVRPKDKQTGKLLGNHAVLCIRGDTSGMITIANWGEFSHGRLINRPDGQWFIPRDATQHELRINSLTTLVPFTPQALHKPYWVPPSCEDSPAISRTAPDPPPHPLGCTDLLHAKGGLHDSIPSRAG